MSTAQVLRGLSGQWLRVRVEFQERVLGTLPKEPLVLQEYLQANANPPLTPEQVAEEVVALPSPNGESEDKAKITVFARDDRGLHLWDYHFRGFLKEAARALRLTVPGRRRATVNLTDNLLQQYVYVFPRRLYLMREGKIIKEPDGLFSRPLRAMTMQGPRVSIAVSEYVDPPVSFEAKLFILDGPITGEVVESLLPYGQLAGIGQWRSGSHGRFVAELMPIEHASD